MQVVYFYSEVETTHTTKPDGTEIFEFANGQIEKYHSNGVKVSNRRLGERDTAFGAVDGAGLGGQVGLWETNQTILHLQPQSTTVPCFLFPHALMLWLGVAGDSVSGRHNKIYLQ